MKKNYKFLALIGALLLLFVSVLSFPAKTMESVTFSISIWKDNLFPTLFPFLIISFLFTNYGISFLFAEMTKPIVVSVLHLPSYAGFLLVASLFSGFPSNAKLIKDALEKKEITEEQAHQLLRFCFFPNPLFVIGTVGGLFLGDVKLGFLLLIAHYLASFLIAFFSRKKEKVSPSTPSFRQAFYQIREKIKQSDSFANVLKQAIFTSFDTMILLLGIIIFFLLITHLFMQYIPLSPLLHTIFSGILEMTQGIKAASLLTIPLAGRMILLSGILAFGGICIHTQMFSILGESAPRYTSFLRYRILHVLLSIIILIALLASLSYF